MNYYQVDAPLVEAESYDEGKQVVIFDFKGERKFVNDIYNNSYISFKSIDLTGVDEIVLGYLRDGSGRSTDGVVELRIGSPTGELLSKLTTDVLANDQPHLKVDKTGKFDLYFVFKCCLVGASASGVRVLANKLRSLSHSVDSTASSKCRSWS